MFSASQSILRPLQEYICSPFFISRFFFTQLRKSAIPYNFFTVDDNVHTYDCMRIALSLRFHHRAKRLFTIPLRGSAVNTEQLCQSIRIQNFTVRRAICPYCTVGSRLRTNHRCCRAICPYCTVGSFGRHFLLNVMWHGFDQSHFEYILRCYIKLIICISVKSHPIWFNKKMWTFLRHVLTEKRLALVTLHNENGIPNPFLNGLCRCIFKTWMERTYDISNKNNPYFSMTTEANQMGFVEMRKMLL